MSLSKRLRTVSAYIPHGMILADIGSDHAYLPCYAVLNGIVPKAIAGEVNEGPYQSAKGQVSSLMLEDKIDVRKGDGLQVISIGEVNVITIAGMGGQLISNILENGKEKLKGVEYLILQPNVGAHFVRAWLLHNNYQLKDEQIIEEDGKIYEVLYAKAGNSKVPYNNFEKELLFGPFLLKQKSEIFKKKWHLERKSWENVLIQLENASAEQVEKKEDLYRKIRLVKEVFDNETR